MTNPLCPKTERERDEALVDLQEARHERDYYVEKVDELRNAGNLLCGAADEFLILTKHYVSPTPALQEAIDEWRTALMGTGKRD